MLRNILCFLSLSVLLVGCEVTEQTAIDKATEMIATKLKDPESARFSDLKFYEERIVGDTHYGYICGAVNSRNSLGGYTGDVRFSANMNYSKAGRIAVSYLELEEGTKAEEMSDGVTYFEHFYWNKRCIVTEKKPVASVENKGSIKLKVNEDTELVALEIPSKIGGMCDGWSTVESRKPGQLEGEGTVIGCWKREGDTITVSNESGTNKVSSPVAVWSD